MLSSRLSEDFGTGEGPYTSPFGSLTSETEEEKKRREAEEELKRKEEAEIKKREEEILSRVPHRIATVVLEETAAEGKKADKRKEREAEEAKRLEMEDRFRKSELKDFHKKYREDAQKGDIWAINMCNVAELYDKYFYDKNKPKDHKDQKSFDKLSPTVATALGVVYATGKAAMSIIVFLPGGPLILFVAAIVTDTSPRKKGTLEQISDFLGIDDKKRSTMTEREMEKQEERVKTPLNAVSTIMEKVNLHDSFHYMLNKNKLEAYQALGIKNEGLARSIRQFEEVNKNNPQYIPFIASSFGSPPFQNECKKIFEGLSFENRKELFQTVNMKALNDVRFSSIRNNIQAVIEATNEDEYKTTMGKLSIQEQKILLGLCDSKKYETIVKKDLSEKMVNNCSDEDIKKLTEDTALNRYINKIELFSPWGVVSQSQAEKAFSGHSVESFKKLSPEKQKEIYKKVVQSGETRTRSDGINVSACINSQVVETIYHEAVHANFAVLPQKVKEGFVRPVKELEKKMEEEINDKVKEKFPDFQLKTSGTKQELIENLESMGVKMPSDPSEKREFMEMVDTLHKMMTDKTFNLKDGDGMNISNTLPNMDNEFLKLYLAFKLYGNLGRGKASSEVLSKIQAFEAEGKNKELIAAYDWIYLAPLRATGHYSFKNDMERVEESVPRIAELTPKLKEIFKDKVETKSSKGIGTSAYNFFDKLVGKVGKNSTDERLDNRITRHDFKEYGVKNVLNEIFEKIGSIGGYTFLTGIPLENRAGFELGGHSHSSGTHEKPQHVGKGFYNEVPEKSKLSNDNNMPYNAPSKNVQQHAQGYAIPSY